VDFLPSPIWGLNCETEATAALIARLLQMRETWKQLAVLQDDDLRPRRICTRRF
jgi:hypothetical protein